MSQYPPEYEKDLYAAFSSAYAAGILRRDPQMLFQHNAFDKVLRKSMIYGALAYTTGLTGTVYFDQKYWVKRFGRGWSYPRIGTGCLGFFLSAMLATRAVRYVSRENDAVVALAHHYEPQLLELFVELQQSKSEKVQKTVWVRRQGPFQSSF